MRLYEAAGLKMCREIEHHLMFALLVFCVLPDERKQSQAEVKSPGVKRKRECSCVSSSFYTKKYMLKLY